MDADECTSIEKLDGNTWYRLLAGTIPYAGGVLGAVNLKAQRAREARLRSFLESLGTRVRGLEEEAIKKEFFETEEFYSLLEFVWTQVARSRDEDKNEYLAAVFLSAIRVDAPDIALLELLKKHLLAMSGAHLQMLRYVYEKQKRYSASDRAQYKTPIPGELPVTLDNIKEDFPNYDMSLIRVLCHDLVASGMLGDWALTHPGERIQTSFYLSDNGLVFMDQLAKHLKSTGKPNKSVDSDNQ